MYFNNKITSQISNLSIFCLGLGAIKNLRRRNKQVRVISMTQRNGVTNCTPLPQGTWYQPIKVCQVQKNNMRMFFF